MMDETNIGGDQTARVRAKSALIRRRLSRLAAAILQISRPAKRAIAVSVDAALCCLATWVAFYLRLGEWVSFSGTQWIAVALSIVLAIPMFVYSGLYRAIFRHSGTTALLSVAQASLVYGVAYATIITLIQIPTIPRTVGVIQPVLLFLFVASSRVLASWLLGEAYSQLLGARARQSVMIYGAGFAGRQLFQALASSEMRVVGFIDDDPALHGNHLFRRPVFAPHQLPELILRQGVTDVLLALPSAKRRRHREISVQLEKLGVNVRTLPGVTDLARGLVEVSEKEIDIGALLNRKTVAPNQALLASNVTGKIVLVTGAGGSIGSELCRQILRMRPEKLLLVDFSEVALYTIHQELEHRERCEAENTRLIPLLASICDERRMRGIITAWQPQTIYHAAAYKHVPLVEHNPADGVWNNVFGTLTIAEIAREAQVASFVFVSTDKAVRPTNIMGATKRLAELVLQALSALPSQTCFSMVRFGNVLGSSGSVVPLFQRQIRAGGPITITHPEITRYFMTIPEAAQLVIQAGAMAKGGDVFVLDMGDPIKITDLAHNMARLSNLTISDGSAEDGDIEIAFVGLRPGEKLYEELLIGNDPKRTEHPKIMRANEHSIAWAKLHLRLDALRQTVTSHDVRQLILILCELIEEYVPDKSIVDWVHAKAALKSSPVYDEMS